ncbi:MAG TPA: hypothetical protein VEC57_00320 [Candidatus Limnocylindrales bacterium]|nr:hypothetical protein [Candidatus Limnocylindrales bacterium]
MIEDPKSTVGGYAAELSAKLASVAERARAAGWWGAHFWCGVLRIILDDLIAALTELRDAMYGAEQRQREALSRIAAAQCPTSEGGTAITPAEARTFVPLIANSAERLSEISDGVKVAS